MLFKTDLLDIFSLKRLIYTYKGGVILLHEEDIQVFFSFLALVIL